MPSGSPQATAHKEFLLGLDLLRLRYSQPDRRSQAFNERFIIERLAQEADRSIADPQRPRRSVEFRYRRFRPEPGQPDGDIGKARPGSSFSSIAVPRADRRSASIPTLSQPKSCDARCTRNRPA